MNLNVNINELKRNLNIEESFTDDDVFLQNILNVADNAVQTYLGTLALTGYTEVSVPIEIHHSVILLASHFYLNRNMVSYAQGFEIPYSFKFLLAPYKDYIVG